MEKKHLDYILQHFYSIYAIPDNIKNDFEKGTAKVRWPEVALDFFEGEFNHPTYKTHKILEKKSHACFQKEKIYSFKQILPLNWDLTG
jgi:hypothetical protein